MGSLVEAKRHRITLQRRSEGSDAEGYSLDEWVDVVQVWASVKDLSGHEFYAAAENWARSVLSFTIRRREVDASMRVVYGGKPYEVIRVYQGQHNGRDIVLDCKNVVEG